MKKLLFFSIQLIFIHQLSKAATFTSNVASGSWNAAATWTVVGADADGIPDYDDDVTIAVGHNITSSTSNYVRNLTVNGTLTTSVYNLNIKGDYVLNGTETGNGAMAFQVGTGTLISGTGTFGASVVYAFASSRTISSNVVMTKTVATSFYMNGATITNMGNIKITAINASGAAAFVNGANASLTISTAGFMTGRSFTANAVGNTVTIKYAAGAIPVTVSGYYNLAIAGVTAGTKTLPAATVVANDFSINALNTLSANGFNLTVGHNWTSSGTFTPGTATVILNGATAQTVGGTVTTAFSNLTKNTANTVTLTNNITVSTLLSISAGILDGSTFGITGAGGLTMTGGELKEGKLTTIPELTGAYTLTAGDITLSGAGAQTVKASPTYFNLNAAGSGTKTLAGILNVNGSLNISSALDVTAANNYAINLKGNWTNTGTFSQQTGTVTFNGTSAQSISGTSTTFENLTLSNTAGAAVTSGAYTLNGVLTLSNGTFNTGGNTFVMTSTASKTARIAPITGTGAAAGNFTIQRFITTRDTTWADFSTPVQGTTFGDWANELPAVYYGYAPPNLYPTQYTYDETADDFSPIISAGTALTPGKGVEVFLSGDFSYSNLPNTTINTIGVPNQGNQDFSALMSFNSAGSNLMGNPFASSISWTSVFAASSGILNTYDVYDYTAGTYSTHGVGTEIGATQGFWVYTTSSAAHLLINESAKTTSANSSVKSVVAEPYLALKLSSSDAGNKFTHTLKVAATDVASDGWDDSDHPFRKSPNKLAPAIYTVIDAKKSVINSFNLSNDSYSMPIQVTVGISGSYKIEASGFENVSDYSCIKLEDTKLNKTVDLTAGPYPFQVNVGDNSDRFILHLSKNSDCKFAAIAKDLTTAVPFEDQITVLPTAEGNSIAFDLDESTPATITVTNVLGQTLVEGMAVTAQSQTVNIALPQGFSGMYILKVQSAKGVITKKYVRK